jgi:hypothetical protein
MPKTILLAGLLLAAAAAMVAAPPAQAFPPAGTPIVINPGPLNGGAPDASSAIFAFADAADQSTLNLTMPAFGSNPIFTNNNGDPIGLTKSLGVLAGPVVFQLNNLTTGINFPANVADVNGNFHAYYTGMCNNVATCNGEYAVFGAGALAMSVADSIEALLAVDPSTDFTIVGWEDLIDGDWDYNDLIFVFSNVTAEPPVTTPEPASLVLLGSALVFLGVAYRRGRSRSA